MEKEEHEERKEGGIHIDNLSERRMWVTRGTWFSGLFPLLNRFEGAIQFITQENS